MKEINANGILVIDGAMVSRSPHVAVYLKLLEKYGVKYDVINWNRRGDDLSAFPDNFHIYNCPTNDHYPPHKKIFEILKFYRYAKEVIRKGDYDKIILFEIANSIPFISILIKEFDSRYIFDIRDYSPVCKLKIANICLNKIIQHSFRTVISSKGFTKWLPKGFEYLVSHNIAIDLLDQFEGNELVPLHTPVRLLTIGNLRDPYTNILFLKSFGNNQRYSLYYVGDGLAQNKIKQYSIDNSIVNVDYYGHYEKQDEVSFYEWADMVNCCMNDNMTSRYLMSNRIYLSALFCKPIICLEGSYQSDVVREYHLGVIIKGNDIEFEVSEYIKTFSHEIYMRGREEFLSTVKDEQLVYANEVKNFLES